MEKTTKAEFWGDAEIISSYSRAQALEDGELVDVSSTAREAGIKFPVALTRAVWASYVEVPVGVECQDEAGRLWDILWLMRCAIKAAAGPTDRFVFKLHVRNTNRPGTPPLVSLRAVCGPGDDPAPVITIMRPDES